MRDTNESLSEKPTGSQEYTEEDYIRDTEKHVRLVQTFLSTLIQELEQRAEQHDASKFEEPEKSIFIKHTPALRGISFGSEGYKKHREKVREALDHHYANNRHHPEWEDFNMVEWKDIKGYEGLYQISNHGDVRSLDRIVKRAKQGDFVKKGKRMKSYVTPKGYLRIQLSKEGKSSNFMVHRLVAEHFVDNPDPMNKTQVNHKDANKKNNYYKNLEWCDNGENQIHAYQTGLNEAKYVIHCVDLDITTIGCGAMERKLKELGYDNAKSSTILRCVHDEQTRHLGLTFIGYVIKDFERSRLTNMNLVDIVEMFADWMASSIKYEGDIYESIRVSQERFGFSDELKQIFENTAILFNKIDR